jgi:hypothetical protein
MRATELDTKNAGFYAFAAMRDARMRAIANWSHYTDKQKVQAERIKLGLELVYSTTKIYIDPRKNFITIKVENARVRDKANLAMLEEDYEKAGITKIITPQGISYRIPKA